jgi:hypothetical protein
MHESALPPKEELMGMFLMIAAVSILGFLCFTSPDGVIGTKRRP